MKISYGDTMWVLSVFSSVFIVTVSGLTTGDEFEYLQRRLEDNDWTLSDVSDIEDEPDEWPSGSYTLLMSKYGCPRGRWTRGYIAFTWTKPHVMLSHARKYHCDNYNIKIHEDDTRCHQLLSEKTWPTSYSNMLGPFSQYKMTLNFCQKSENTERASTYRNSTWPRAYFRVFDANNGCPNGFYPSYKNITLPPVEKWTGNGFIPYYTLDTDQHEKTILTLRECVRDEWNEQNITNILNTNGSTFILLKDEEHPCPVIETYDVWSEIISIVDMKNTSSDVSHLFQFCFYQPESWNDYNKNSKEIEGYEMKPIKVLYGGTGLLLGSPGTEDRDHTHTMFCSKHTTCWVLIDIGRSLSIKGVSVEKIIPTGMVFNYTVHAGNDKFELIRYGGVEIQHDRVGLTFVGRFLSFVIPSFNSMLHQFNIRVFVGPSDTRCMVDMGMTDGSITKDQISVSSNQISANLGSISPINSGWCANGGDIHPYVQVDLLEELLLDGITIYNWYKTNINITDGAYGKSFTPMGTRSFKVLSSSEENITRSYNMTFYVDLFRPTDEPQTFIFYEHIRARYVRILLLEPMVQGQLCIRFELHGCRNNDIIDRPSLLYRRDSDDSDDDVVTEAVKLLMSPSQFTSVGYPLPYRDGTSYTWIIDFRNEGYIRLIIDEISLRSYEDQSFEQFWYFCKDRLAISSIDSDLTIPTSVKQKNVIIETDSHNVVVQFTSCNPYTPSIKEGTYFNVYTDKSDLPACYLKQYCKQPSMILTTQSLNNIPSDKFIESWIIAFKKYSIRLTILHFHVLCNSGAVLEIKELFTATKSYTDCSPPETVLLSESEQMTITYKVGPNQMRTLMKEGFRAIYSTVEVTNQNLLDTIGYNFQGLKHVGYNTDFSTGNMLSDEGNNGTSFLVYKACSKTFMKCYSIYSRAPMSWQVAGDECWARRKKLVSIHSKEELFIVKCMLRTFRNFHFEDGSISSLYTTDIVDPNHFAHIGISRITKTDGNRLFVWQDGSPVLFSAWNTGEPKPDGDCARMSFHLANKNNSWEVEDCVTQMALFFICEEPVNSLPLPDLASMDSKYYQGTLNTTRNGRTCQRWDSMIPNIHPYTDPDQFPEGNVSQAENFCRDPESDGYIWCYTMDINTRWEKCVQEKLEDWTPEKYTGRLSTTVSGYTCQRWDSQSPHTHSNDVVDYFPDSTLFDAANYCRDPAGETGALWCFTTDSSTRWDYCRLKDTISDRCYETHYPYLGTLNVTYSGLTCQHWSSSYPHKHYYGDAKFPDGSLSRAENYCRDPSNVGYIWCYTTDPDVRWETCAFPVNAKGDSETSISNVFTCNDGYQISTKKICNGIVDCSDAQDELNCTYKVQKLIGSHVMPEGKGTRLDTMFRCGSDESIALLAECDGVVDCIDGSDESFCERGAKECSSDEFQCGDGRCIHASLVCDFIPHCTDFSDENCYHPECKYGEYRCKNGQCIPMSNRCNAYKECVDGSDEQTCDTCSTSAFHCDLTKCIPKRLVCDNIPDCRDMEDEKRCKDKQYPTCQDRWINGLRKNGHYSLTGNTIAECNFDNVEKDGSVTTLFHAVEYWSEYDESRHFIEMSSTSTSEMLKFLSNTNCHQTFEQTCTFPVRTIAEIMDKNFENEYKHCQCVALTVVPNQPKTAFVHACGNTSSKLDASLMYVTYNYSFPGAALAKRMPFNNDLEIKVGPITCKNDSFLAPKSHQYKGKQDTTIDGIPCQRWDEQFPHGHDRTDPNRFPDSTLESAENYCRDPDRSGYIWCYTTDPVVRWQMCIQENIKPDVTTTYTCEEDGFTYEQSLRCIYETDEAGYLRGCRSGSHLQDCATFSCPDETTQCPDSYCIPIHYVCDGINQCPGGADEEGCDCNNDDLEVILMASTEELSDKDLKLRQVAGQFNHLNAIVRIVYYDAYTDQDKPFEHKLMQISDTEVNLRDVVSQEYECTYGMMTSQFMNQVKFTKVKSRGLIFIQNGTVSESVARPMFQNLSEPEFEVYRLVMSPSIQLAGEKDDEYRHVTDIRVNNLDIMTSMGSKLFPSLCKDSLSTVCKDSYKCSSSLLCIAFDKVCDGFAHCPLSDDEMFCEFVCPSVCTCTGYSANCKSATFENSTNISQDIDRRLRVLDLSTNTRVGTFANSNDDLIFKFPYMIRLNLSACDIWQISTNYFEHLPNLRSLDLSYNKISRIPRRAFFGLSKLVYLNIYGNKGFMIYESFAFLGLTSLRNIDIMDSDINSISYKTFSGLRLDTLKVSKNKILEMSNDAFSGLTVSKIFFELNSITTFDGGIFNGISGLELLRTSAYKYCCVRPDYLPESSCFPERDEFSSCDDLMRNSALQTMLWLMGICALLGNILAVAYRIVYDREKLKLGFGIIVTHLAVSDLLMGVYLLIIAIADASYRQRYIFMDEYWRNSGWCTLAGVLSTVSSEASVLFLCLITLDRFLVIKYPFSRLRFTPRNASIAAAVAWIISLSISITPLIVKDHFQNRFYSKSGVCVALPLTRDRPPGWLYSVIIFIGVNFVTFIGIAIGQLSIYNEINNASSKIRTKRGGKSKASRRKELVIARNLLLVVATDFMCWFPIGLMGIMAMSGYIIPGEVYAWVAVFILPVNSAINPILYTLTAILGRQKAKAAVETGLSKRITKSTKRKQDNEKLISYFIHQIEKYSTKMTSVESLVVQNVEMSPKALLKFTIQLTYCLRLLHKNSLVLENLDAKSVFVPMQCGKFVGDLQIRQQPSSKVSLENKTENIYKLGVIVRRLMACNSHQC